MWMIKINVFVIYLLNIQELLINLVSIMFKKLNQHKFIPVLYHSFSKYDNLMFSNDLINSNKDKMKLSVIPKTNEEYMSVTYRCIKFLDNMRFQQESLEKLTNL